MTEPKKAKLHDEQEDPAVTRFRSYLRVNTVQPLPDYGGEAASSLHFSLPCTSSTHPQFFHILPPSAAGAGLLFVVVVALRCASALRCVVALD